MPGIFTSDFIKEALMGALRHVLTGFAGVLVSEGLIMGSQTNDFIGSGLFLAGIAWSWWNKHNQQTALNNAGGMPAHQQGAR